MKRRDNLLIGIRKHEQRPTDKVECNGCRHDFPRSKLTDGRCKECKWIGGLKDKWDDS